MMHRLWSVALSVAIFLVLCAPLAATSPTIGVYLDRDCTMCSGTVALLVPFTFYLSARLEAPLSDGIVGASFRVDGLPASWNTIYVPMVVEASPGLSVLGDPFTGGCDVGFDGCTGSLGCVPLFTCHVVPFADDRNVRLIVRHHPSPVNCGKIPCCPLLFECDAPFYTAMCVPGGEAVFNGPPCTVGVAQATWTQIKRLYN
jgi:hypothetical protein